MFQRKTLLLTGFLHCNRKTCSHEDFYTLTKSLFSLGFLHSDKKVCSCWDCYPPTEKFVLVGISTLRQKSLSSMGFLHSNKKVCPRWDSCTPIKKFVLDGIPTLQHKTLSLMEFLYTLQQKILFSSGFLHSNKKVCFWDSYTLTKKSVLIGIPTLREQSLFSSGFLHANKKVFKTKVQFLWKTHFVFIFFLKQFYFFGCRNNNWLQTSVIGKINGSTTFPSLHCNLPIVLGVWNVFCGCDSFHNQFWGVLRKYSLS